MLPIQCGQNPPGEHAISDGAQEKAHASLATVITPRFFLPLLLFLSFLTLYLRTLAPDIILMDGVEYALAGHLIGIPHAPGYPLFTLLNKLFQLLPIGNIAYRSNLLCAIISCATVTLLYLLLAGRWRSPLAALITVMSLGLSAGFWENAVKNEAYSLHLLFIVLLLTILLRRPADARTLLLTLFVLGLSLANHQVMLLFCPALALFVLIDSNLRRACRRILLPASSLFLLGISVYLLLILRAAQNPLMNRGDPSTLDGLMHVMAARFTMASTNIADNPSSSSTLHLKHYWFLTHHEWAWPLLLFLPIGIAALFRLDPKLLALTLVGWLVQTAVITFTFYTGSEDIVYMVEPFFIPSHLFVLIWIGGGVAATLRKFHGVASHALGIVALAVCVTPLIHHVYANDQSQNFIVKDWAYNVFRSTADSAVILVAVDEYFPLSYHQIVEKMRPDVTPVHVIALAFFPRSWWRLIPQPQQPRVFFPIGADTPASIPNFRSRVIEGMTGYVSRNEKRPFVMAHFDSGIVPQGNAPVLTGIAYKLLAGEEQNPSPTMTVHLWSQYRRRGLTISAPGVGPSERRILDNYTVSLNNLAGLYLFLNEPRNAAETFYNVLAIDPQNSVALKYVQPRKL